MNFLKGTQRHQSCPLKINAVTDFDDIHLAEMHIKLNNLLSFTPISMYYTCNNLCGLYEYKNVERTTEVSKNGKNGSTDRKNKSKERSMWIFALIAGFCTHVFVFSVLNGLCKP